MGRRKKIETAWGAIPGTKKERAARHRQTSLAEVPTWGGRRERAGRPRGPRPNVAHRARPPHSHWRPVHTTLRRAKGLPSFRTERLHDLLREAIREIGRDPDAGFRIVHYSIQADHVHLIVEADEDGELSKGMRSFVIRVAMRVNALLRRPRGRVWGDRYHRHDLESPREVRNVLVYVLANHLKHGDAEVGLLDPFSSGRWFDGWVHGPAPPPEPSPTTLPRTWVLREGWWQKYGYLHLGERPRTLRA